MIGGAIRAVDAGLVELHSCTFSANSAAVGGALALSTST